MARTLSLVLAAACSAVLIFGSNVNAQEEKKQKCQCELRIESSAKAFLIPKVQFEVKFDKKKGENSEPSKIVPMMSGLPVVGTLFKEKRLEVEVETPSTKDCPKDAKKCCQEGCCDSDKKCCPASKQEGCKSCPSATKFVFSPACNERCNESCNDGCKEGCCVGLAVGSNTFCPNVITSGTCCPADHPFAIPGIQLSGHFEPVAPSTFDRWHADPRLEEMMELRLQNERLRVEMAGMKERMKLVERMAEMRAYTAQLEARIATMQQRSNQAGYSVPARTYYPSQPTRVMANPYVPVSPQWQPAPTTPSCCPNHAQPSPNCNSKAIPRSAAVPVNGVPLSTVRSATLTPPPLPYHKPVRATSVPMPNPPVSQPPRAATPAKIKAKPASNRSTKPSTSSTRRLPTANVVQVPDGGTILFGGSIKRKAQLLPSISATSSKQVAKPVTRNRERELEMQIALLTAQIAKMKQEQSNAKAKIQVGVPMSTEWKSFKNVTPQPKKQEKKKSNEEKTFSLSLGTIR